LPASVGSTHTHRGSGAAPREWSCTAGVELQRLQRGITERAHRRQAQPTSQPLSTTCGCNTCVRACASVQYGCALVLERACACARQCALWACVWCASVRVGMRACVVCVRVHPDTCSKLLRHRRTCNYRMKWEWVPTPARMRAHAWERMGAHA
jgi:hypothetical protein